MTVAPEVEAAATELEGKAKVVKVGSLMRMAPAGLNGVAIPERATVAEAAPRFGGGIEILRVEDSDGKTAGALHRDDVVDRDRPRFGKLPTPCAERSPHDVGLINRSIAVAIGAAAGSRLWQRTSRGMDSCAE